MNATIKLTCTVVIGIFVLLLVPQTSAAEEPSPLSASGPSMAVEAPYGPVPEVPDGHQTDWGHYFKPVGTWLGSNDLGMTYLMSLSSLDIWQRKFSIVADGANDPTLGGYFPTVVDAPNLRGEMIRTGLNTYDFTQVTYGVDAAHAIVLYVTVSGSVELTGNDTLELQNMHIAMFAPGQDPFGDEPPMYGCMGPISAAYTRLPIMPPCEP